MSDDVVLGGTHLSWLQTLSETEILQWPVDRPHFPEDIEIVRDRVCSELGLVEVPTTWDGARVGGKGQVGGGDNLETALKHRKHATCAVRFDSSRGCASLAAGNWGRIRWRSGRKP
jgi:hypothetical protein